MSANNPIEKSFLKKRYLALQNFFEPLIRFFKKGFNWVRELLGYPKKQDIIPPTTSIPPQETQTQTQANLEVEEIAKKETADRFKAEEQQRKMEAKLRATEEAEAEKQRIEQEEKAEAASKAFEIAEKERIKAKQEKKAALYKAITEGEVLVIEEYLKPGWSAITETAAQLLYAAVVADRVEIVELLMKHQVDLNCTCTQLDPYKIENSALYFAIDHLKPNMVKFLLNQKVKVTRSAVRLFENFEPGKMEVHSNENFEIIANLFLEANLDIILYPDTTPGHLHLLLYAIKSGHIEIVKRALDHLDSDKTKIYLYKHSHSSIIEWAMGCNQKEIVKLLLVHYKTHRNVLETSKRDLGYREDHLFQNAIRSNDMEVAKAFIHSSHVSLQTKNDPNFSRRRGGRSAIYQAMKNKNPEMVEWLLSEGAHLGDVPYNDNNMKAILDYKEAITPLYNKELECLDNVVPTVLKEIISGYVVPYIDPPTLPNVNSNTGERITPQP